MLTTRLDRGCRRPLPALGIQVAAPTLVLVSRPGDRRIPGSAAFQFA